MSDYSEEERDVRRRERRVKREPTTRRERNHKSETREDVAQGPDIEELRRARTDFYTISGGSSKVLGSKRVVKMPSASTSRVSVSSTKSASRHKHKSRRKHASASDASSRRRKGISKEKREKVSTEEYVYEINGERIKETRTTYLEKKPASEDSSPEEEEDDEEEEETMSDIQEESESDKKIRIIYIKKDRPSRRDSTQRDDRERSGSDLRYSNRKSMIEPESPIRIER